MYGASSSDLYCGTPVAEPTRTILYSDHDISLFQVAVILCYHIAGNFDEGFVI